MTVAQTESTYPISTFLAWLTERGTGLVGARGRGCRNLPSLARPEDRVPAALAQEWADAMDVELDEIWPDGPATAPAEAEHDAPILNFPGAGLAKPRPAYQPRVAHPDGPKPVEGPAKPVEVPKPRVDLPAAARTKTIHVNERAMPLRRGYAPCPVCGLPKREKLSLPAHVKAAHPDYDWAKDEPMYVAPAPPTFYCDHPDCGRTFKSRFGLDRHRSAHEPKPEAPQDGEQCPFCPRYFPPGVAMRNHVRHAHDKDPDEIYGVPTYRSRGPLSAQQVGAPKDRARSAVLASTEMSVWIMAEKEKVTEALTALRAEHDRLHNRLLALDRCTEALAELASLEAV